MVALVAVAATLHVTWNVLLKTAADPLRAATVGMAAGAVLLVPSAAVAWWLVDRPPIPPAGLALGLVSGALEALYFWLLSAGYRRGDLSVVYPLARGTATLLAVTIGIVLLGERHGPVGYIGLASLLIGFLGLQRPWRALGRVWSRNRDGSANRRRGGQDAAILFALATGVVISSYSALDRVGAQMVPPWLYAAILWASASTSLVALAWLTSVRARRLATAAATATAAGPSIRDDVWASPLGAADRRGALAGVLGVVQYVLILFALSIAPLSAVAPLRESAIVLASGWGAIRLGEAAGRRDAAGRIGAAALIVVGAVLLAFEG